MKSEASRASLLRFSAASVGLTTPLYSIGWSYEAYLLMLRGKGGRNDQLMLRRRVGSERAARFLAVERRREPDLPFPSLARSEGIGFHL